jgi:hypothetical protein
MGGWDDDTAVQRKAQLRLLASLPALRLQGSAERTEAPGIAHHPPAATAWMSASTWWRQLTIASGLAVTQAQQAEKFPLPVVF